MASKEDDNVSISSEFTKMFLRKLQENLEYRNQNPVGRIYIKELVSVYANEIASMMHTLGDVAQPLKNSVKYLETILRDQMNLLLIKASEVSDSKTLTHAHLLTLLVNKREKMTRLLHYLFLKDSSELLGKKKYDQFFDAMSSSQFGVRVKTCLGFLKSIDAGDYDPETIANGSDEVALERIARRFQMSNKMSNENYLEFSKKQRICFYPKGDGGKFKDWLLADKVTRKRPTALALDILAFFAKETIAEVVEASLPIGQPNPEKPVNSVFNVRGSFLKNNPHSTTDQPETFTDFDSYAPNSLSRMLGFTNIITDDSGSSSNVDSLVSRASLGIEDIDKKNVFSRKRKRDIVDSDEKSNCETSVMRENRTSRSNLLEPKIPARSPGNPITVEDLKSALINSILSSPGKFYMRKKKKILCLK